MKQKFLTLFTVLLAALSADAYAEVSASPHFTSPFLAIGLDSRYPAFSWFSVDSLGRGENLTNVVLAEKLPAGGDTLKSDGDGRYRYVRSLPDGREIDLWHVGLSARMLTLRASFAAGVDAPAFILPIDQKKNHATLLGLPGEKSGHVRTPAVLHLPDRGTLRITANDAQATLENDVRRWEVGAFVLLAFPPASHERAQVEYSIETVLIHPELPGLADNPRYDGYRRNFLNLIQYHPRLRTLANNSSSDVCGLCFWQYAELGRQAPPLAPGLTVLDLVRVSLDRVMDGGLTYGQAGYGKTPNYPDTVPWDAPIDSLDTLPSFIIASSHYLLGSHDVDWAEARFDRIVAWAREMLAQDRDGNGLIEHGLSGNSGSWDGKTRPANWWDTIGFGHEDAYSNALAFRACLLLSEAARNFGRMPEAKEFAAAAQKIKSAYRPAFFNPETGVLAGWKSADGKLHDYWFTFINGMAVSFGLIDDRDAHAIMDHLLAKMDEVGFHRFDLGLPGNLVPIRKEDYTDPRKQFGGSEGEDGSDGFQIYENGGATHCHAYWTIKALYRLGRAADARRIFHPMLESFAKGEFQGFGPNGLSKDWRSWTGECKGYEGFLSDGFLALLAVEDDMLDGLDPRL